MAPLHALLARASTGRGGGSASDLNNGQNSVSDIDLNVIVPVVCVVVLIVAIIAGTIFIRRRKAAGEKVPAYS